MRPLFHYIYDCVCVCECGWERARAHRPRGESVWPERQERPTATEAQKHTIHMKNRLNRIVSRSGVPVIAGYSEYGWNQPSDVCATHLNIDVCSRSRSLRRWNVLSFLSLAWKCLCCSAWTNRILFGMSECGAFWIFWSVRRKCYVMWCCCCRIFFSWLCSKINHKFLPFECTQCECGSCRA